jgi:hypothetical protein
MSNQEHKQQYDVVSLTRAGQKKRANYVQNSLHMSKAQSSTGQFVRVFADIFLKHEAGKKSYF